MKKRQPFPWPLLFQELQAITRNYMSQGSRLVLTLTCRHENAIAPRVTMTRIHHRDRIVGLIQDGLIARLSVSYLRHYLRFSCDGCQLFQDVIRQYRCETARVLARIGVHYCEHCMNVLVECNAWWLVPDMWLQHCWGTDTSAWHAKICRRDPSLCLNSWLTEIAIAQGNERFATWLQTHGHWSDYHRVTLES